MPEMGWGRGRLVVRGRGCCCQQGNRRESAGLVVYLSLSFRFVNKKWTLVFVKGESFRHVARDTDDTWVLKRWRASSVRRQGFWFGKAREPVLEKGATKHGVAVVKSRRVLPRGKYKSRRILRTQNSKHDVS